MTGHRLFIPALSLLVFMAVHAVRSRAADKCFVCHEALGGKPALQFMKDIHRQKGIPCAGCHGGDATSDDMDRAMSKAVGFVGVPKGDDISKTCSRCHAQPDSMLRYGSRIPTAQSSDLSSSVHAKKSLSGREGLVQCTSCHGAHGIVSAKNPLSPVYPLNIVRTCSKCHADAAYIRAYNPSLPVDQLEKYRTSVHGRRNARGDVKVAECASCHGSHRILPSSDMKSAVSPGTLPSTCGRCHSDAQYMKPYGIPTDQLEKFSSSVHGVALLQKRDRGAPACNSCHGNHGAVPPGVESISKVCGTCHALNEELFASSPHKPAFDEMGLPECETCHGNHEIVVATTELLGTGPESVCSRCHSEQERPNGYRLAQVMRGMMDSLESSERLARSLVAEAEQKGMEISEAKFKLRDVHQARLEARTAIHAFDEGRFQGVIDKGLSTAALVSTEATDAIHEYSFRRLGLGIATLIITIVAVSLYILIRRLEQHSRMSGAGPASGGRATRG